MSVFATLGRPRIGVELPAIADALELDTRAASTTRAIPGVNNLDLRIGEGVVLVNDIHDYISRARTTYEVRRDFQIMAFAGTSNMQTVVFEDETFRHGLLLKCFSVLVNDAAATGFVGLSLAFSLAGAPDDWQPIFLIGGAGTYHVTAVGEHPVFSGPVAYLTPSVNQFPRPLWLPYGARLRVTLDSSTTGLLYDVPYTIAYAPGAPIKDL